MNSQRDDYGRNVFDRAARWRASLRVHPAGGMPASRAGIARLLSALVLALCLVPGVQADDALSLAGRWQFRLDPQDVGAQQKWFAAELPDSIALPGTTDQAGKGYPLDRQTMSYPVEFLRTRWPGTAKVHQADTAGYLVRPWYYVGKAWYQRQVEIPASWRNKHVRLRLERSIWQTRVWVDDRAVGACDSLVAEHRFDLGVLPPGAHRLSVCVDNGMIHNIGIAGHAYGPETQSRWNGVVGRLELAATSPVFVDRVQVYPAADRRSVRVVAEVNNTTGTAVAAVVDFEILGDRGAERFGSARAALSVEPGRSVVEQTVAVTAVVEPWDEFHLHRYRLAARLQAGEQRHAVEQLFGFRHIERDGRTIRVNGRRIFLRGTLDCCVYPKTGHPPMSLRDWLRVMRVIKDHGFNHVRYHSWCPPEAAFEAADRLGLYLTPETPFWVDRWITKTASKPKLLGQDPDVLDYIRREIRRMADAYGNHPSFAFFCIGNEFGTTSDWDQIDRLLAEAKHHDPRRLYTASTTRQRVPADDYWVTAHAPNKAPVRGIGPPHTNWDFSRAARSIEQPVIAHETGQRPVFPDYDDLLPKFTGPLKPYNMERFRARLAAAGMADQAKEFERASARFQYVLYKAEHEAFLRTSDYAGYELLMLNDFTGQSEALVGIVDPFWEPKGVVQAEEVRQWCGPVVPLARFDRYTWTSDETFTAAIEVANFGPADLAGATAAWSLATASGRTVAGGTLGPTELPTGGLTPLGSLQAPLGTLARAEALTLRVTLGDAVNQWTVWCYPPARDSQEPRGVVVARRWDDGTRQALAGGGRVLLLAHGLRGKHTVQTHFPSLYWSAGWFPRGIETMGMLCKPDHPALADFPNGGHSDWQWFELTEGATTFVLDGAPRGYRPIIQAVTDFHQNRLLGQLFEARVGDGRLVVCGYDLVTDLDCRHAARQLRRSLLAYIESDAFDPPASVPAETISSWLDEPATP